MLHITPHGRLATACNGVSTSLCRQMSKQMPHSNPHKQGPAKVTNLPTYWFYADISKITQANYNHFAVFFISLQNTSAPQVQADTKNYKHYQEQQITRPNSMRAGDFKLDDGII